MPSICSCWRKLIVGGKQDLGFGCYVLVAYKQQKAKIT